MAFSSSSAASVSEGRKLVDEGIKIICRGLTQIKEEEEFKAALVDLLQVEQAIKLQRPTLRQVQLNKSQIDRVHRTIKKGKTIFHPVHFFDATEKPQEAKEVVVHANNAKSAVEKKVTKPRGPHQKRLKNLKEIKVYSILCIKI